MNRVLLWALSLIVIALIIYKKTALDRKEREGFLKHETHAAYIDPQKLKQKVNAPLPAWMGEQIEEDFRPFEKISKRQVDATYSAIRKNLPQPYYIRYRILKSELFRYFPEGERVSLEDNGLERTLKTLTDLFKLPDCDFIVGYIDGVPCPDVPPDFYHTADASEQAPLLVFARLAKTRHTVLIPDWRSVASWWASDIKRVLSCNQPWEQKREVAFWRGTLTRGKRLEVCRFAKERPELLDFKLVGEGIPPDVAGEFAKIERFLDYKYLPTFDGVIAAYPAFQWRLLSTSVTLKQESDEVQWFFRAVKPYVHYIPLKNDLSDLCDQIAWAKAHDEECHSIAKTATVFALNNLMLEDNYAYLFHVLKKYAALQKLEFKGLRQEMQKEGRWLSLQKRRAFKKRVKQEGKIADYNHWLSPFA